MESPAFIYQKIADHFASEISSTRLKPGDKLPAVRKVAVEWNCTVGTVQKAFHLLAERGLVVSAAGRGTSVSTNESHGYITLRRLDLLRHTEDFLLDSVHKGFTIHEVEGAFRESLDRIRVASRKTDVLKPGNILQFNGSHDLVVSWIAGNFQSIAPGWEMEVTFSGSMRGLTALENRETDLAGSHLWDPETGSWNRPYIEKLFPARPVVLVHLAARTIGLMVQPGNPQHITNLPDLARPGVTFINRQEGSGARTRLDIGLSGLSIDPLDITGYNNVVYTQSEVASAVAAKKADAGFGIQAVANQYKLDFIEMDREEYALVFYRPLLENEAMLRLLEWLNSNLGRDLITGFPGYSADRTGEITYVN